MNVWVRAGLARKLNDGVRGVARLLCDATGALHSGIRGEELVSDGLEVVDVELLDFDCDDRAADCRRLRDRALAAALCWDFLGFLQVEYHEEVDVGRRADADEDVDPIVLALGNIWPRGTNRCFQATCHGHLIFRRDRVYGNRHTYVVTTRPAPFNRGAYRAFASPRCVSRKSAVRWKRSSSWA